MQQFCPSNYESNENRLKMTIKHSSSNQATLTISYSVFMFFLVPIILGSNVERRANNTY